MTSNGCGRICAMHSGSSRTTGDKTWTGWPVRAPPGNKGKLADGTRERWT